MAVFRCILTGVREAATGDRRVTKHEWNGLDPGDIPSDAGMVCRYGSYAIGGLSDK